MKLRRIKRRACAAMLSTTPVEIRGPLELVEWMRDRRAEAIHLLRRLASLRSRHAPGAKWWVVPY